MREVRTEIVINATKEEIFKVLIDTDNWASWNPIVKDVKGTTKLGSQLTVSMAGKNPESKGPVYKAKVVQFEENKKIVWHAKMLFSFLFSNEKILELETTGGKTKFIQIETFSGIMVNAMWDKMKDGVPIMLNMMNEALKENCESKSQKSA